VLNIHNTKAAHLQLARDGGRRAHHPGRD
jgi:hypothetical protein